MNKELLRRLQLEAGGSFYPDINPEMQERFARLIVHECMSCSIWVGKMNTDSVEPVHTAHAINQRIKQHFGVEA